MREISLNELPKYSPWVARLLQEEHFEKPKRDLAKIDEEYNKDKYASLLEHFLHNQQATIMELKRYELQSSKHKETCMSQKGRLFLAGFEELLLIRNETIVNVVAPLLNSVHTIVELGCGYGYNLAVLKAQHPNLNYLGGEYSANAITLGNKLLGRDCIKYFNFYDPMWEILEDLDGPAVILTSHAIEQLPEAKNVLPAILKYRNKIKDVIHLEPAYEMNDTTVLGLLRRAYTRINDYNRDLLTTITELGVTVKRTRYDVCGINPLNPTSLIHWCP